MLGLKIEQPGGSSRQIALQGLVTRRSGAAAGRIPWAAVPRARWCLRGPAAPHRPEVRGRPDGHRSPPAKPLPFLCAQLQRSAPHRSLNGLSSSYFRLALIDYLAFINFQNLKKETFTLFPYCLKTHPHSV